MASIDEISIVINSLFRDIIEPITFSLNKDNLLKKYRNLHFKFELNYRFEFNANPILNFDNSVLLLNFLKREKLLSDRYQDFENADEIQELLSEKDDSVVLDNFYLNYTIEINGDEILLFFNTNSLIFKYEVIG